MSGYDTGAGSSNRVGAEPVIISVKVFIAGFVSGVSMDLCPIESVGSFKLRICYALDLDPAEHRFLTHRDRIMLENQTLEYYAQAGTTSGFHMQDIVHPLASHNGMSGENGDTFDLATRTEMEDMNSAMFQVSAGTLQARTSGFEINQNANSLNSPRETSPQRLGLGTSTGTLPASSTSLQLYQTGLNIPQTRKRHTNFPLPDTRRRRPSTRHTNFPKQSSYQTRPMLVGQQITAQNDRVAAGNMGRPEVLPEEIYDVEVSHMTVSQIPWDPQLQSMNTMDQPQVSRQVSPLIGQTGSQGVAVFNDVQGRYGNQLNKLRDMGFTNGKENTIALFATEGDLPAAFKRLRAGVPGEAGNIELSVINSARERYADQITSLEGTGFGTMQEMVQALILTDGNVDYAADILLSMVS